MDLCRQCNRIPESVGHVHLIAVCGTAMGALAVMLQEMGMRVTGSDAGVYPPMSTYLAEHGIEVMEGFDPARIRTAKPDLVVVGNAISKGNPEAQALAETGLPYCSLPEALDHFLVAGRKPVVITGTHGKTTTSSLMAWVLEEAGMDPGFMIGGFVKNFGGNYKIGTGPFVVLEGDEYDTAFFDKESKFLHYTPHRAILTGVEFDHADIFPDITAIENAFTKFLNRIPIDGRLILWNGSPSADRVCNASGIEADQVIRYGKDAAQWCIAEAVITPPYQAFTILKNGVCFAKIKTRMPGAHNQMNILAVAAVAESLGIEGKTVSRAVASFQGVKRRQEIRGIENGITVMDDFAHHPTAVRATIEAMRPHTKGRLIAVFEPRTNTSMRDVFQREYVASFDGADFVCIREIPMPEKIPEGQRFSSQHLACDLVQKGGDARCFADTDAIIRWIGETAQPGDLVLVMSNGGFDNIHDRLLKVLAAKDCV